MHLARKLLLAQLQLTDNSARMEDMSSDNINLATPEAIHIIPILDTLVTNILTLVVANASMDIVAPTAKVQ